MPNESSGMDLLIIAWSFYVRYLLYAYFASQSVNVRQIVSPTVFFLSPLWVNNCSTVTMKLAIRLDETSHLYLRVNGRGLIEKSLTITDDLDLSRSQPCKITFWAISQLLLDILTPNFNTG